MNKNFERAKQIFFNYACNHFFLDRDVDSEEYKAYSVSSAQEVEWRREYIQYWVGRLSVDDLTAVDRLRDTWAGEAIPDLIHKSSSGDGYAKLWYANAIWALANGANITNELRASAKKTAIQLWQSLLEVPIELSTQHRAIVAPHLGAFNVLTAEEYLAEYAKRKLAESQIPRH